MVVLRSAVLAPPSCCVPGAQPATRSAPTTASRLSLRFILDLAFLDPSGPGDVRAVDHLDLLHVAVGGHHLEPGIPGELDDEVLLVLGLVQLGRGRRELDVDVRQLDIGLAVALVLDIGHLDVAVSPACSAAAASTVTNR